MGNFMIRVMAVLVVAALCASLFGVDEPSWAAQDNAAREAARQQGVAARVDKIRVRSVVKIETVDGRKIEGLLTAKTADSVTVDVYQRRAFRRLRRLGNEMIRFETIKTIKKPLTAAQTALITAAVVGGACALIGIGLAASVESSPRAPQTSGDESLFEQGPAPEDDDAADASGLAPEGSR
jgi:hypothetical protein